MYFKPGLHIVLKIVSTFGVYVPKSKVKPGASRQFKNKMWKVSLLLLLKEQAEAKFLCLSENKNDAITVHLISTDYNCLSYSHFKIQQNY